MLTPKEFLAQECDNIGKLLKDALRFDYGPRGSKTFYEQCESQRIYLREGLDSFNESDTQQISEIAWHVSQLSQLIAKIERSHIGEFSWAFGDAFKCHAEIICSDDDSDDSLTSPLHFIIADGGMTSYSVKPEQSLFGVSARRIFTITAPRSLRHHVLLHPILGHEIGHAAQHVPVRKKFIEGELLPFLLAGGALASQDKLHGLGLTPPLTNRTDSELKATVRAWLVEIACDLIGLVFMGPAFIGAARSLLAAIDGKGESYGPKHPPNTWRFEVLTRAYKKLGWDTLSGEESESLKTAIERFNTKLLSYDATTAKANAVFDAGIIEEAIDKIVAFFDKYPKTVKYAPPSVADLDNLVSALCQARPPLGQRLGTDWGFLDIDYRHILHAGWLAFVADMAPNIELKSEKKFFYMNRLCEQAILQRQGEALVNKNKKDSRVSAGS